MIYYDFNFRLIGKEKLESHINYYIEHTPPKKKSPGLLILN